MKKLFFCLVTAGYSLFVVAGNPVDSWIVSAEGRIPVKKLTIRENDARFVSQDGQKKTVALDQIDSYSVDGKVFKKLPLFIDGMKTQQKVFMELVRNQGELDLYRYSDWSYCPYSKINNYLLYHGDSLVLAYDEKSHP